jgi:hypothetical protein
MRLSDKLLQLHAGATQSGLRRYLLREMERTLAGLDSERVLGALAAGQTAADPGEAFQAARSLERFLPSHVERRFGPPRAQLLSVVAGTKEAEAADEVAMGDIPLRSGSFMLKDAFAKLLAVVEPMLPPASHASLQGVWRYAAPDVQRTLEMLAIRGAGESFAAYLLARRRDERSAGAAGQRLEELAAGQPELLVALGEAGLAERVHRAVAAARKAPGNLWQVPAGIALEGLPPAERVKLFGEIAATRHGWGVIHALGSIARAGGEEDLRGVLAVLKDIQHQMVRIEVMRCLGRMRSANAHEVCRRIVIKDPSSPEAAAALESLARQRIPESELKPIFGAALESTNPEVLAFASLGLVAVDPDRAAAGVRELLTHGDDARVHGVHLLGYLPGAESTRLLARLAKEDPSATVRRQAVASLAYHPPSSIVSGHLQDLLGQVSPELEPFVARALVRAEESPDPEFEEALIAQVNKASGARKAELLEALGMLGLPNGMTCVENVLKSAQDPVELAGALNACAVSGRRWRNMPIRPHLEHAEASVAAAAALAILPEDLEAGLTTATRLAQGGGAATAAGFEALGTIALILDRCLAHPRYKDLIGTIRPFLKSSAYLEFASQALPAPRARAAAGEETGQAMVPQSPPSRITAALAEGDVRKRTLRARPLESEGLDAVLIARNVLESPLWLTLFVASVLLTVRSVAFPPSPKPRFGKAVPLTQRVPSGRIVALSSGAKAGGKPVSANENLTAPVEVEAGAAAVAFGCPPSPGKITLAPRARARVDRVLPQRTGVHLWVTLLDGGLDVEVDEVDSLVTVEVGAARVQLERGKHRIVPDGEGKRVETAAGSARVIEPTGRAHALGAGQARTLDMSRSSR